MSHICPSWLSFILYNPIRKKFTDRNKIIRESMITGDSIVLEVGAGNGFLTEIIAETARKIVVTEIQKGMVKKLQKRVKRFGSKIEIITSDIATSDLDAGFADNCILYYCFHEIVNQQDAVRNIKNALKDKGILSIYEPTVEVGKKAMDNTVNMFSNEGFIKDAENHGIFTRFVRMRKGIRR